MTARRAKREHLAEPTNSRVVTIGEVLNGDLGNSTELMTMEPVRDNVEPEDEYEDDDSDVERICTELGEEIGRSFIKVLEVSKNKDEPEADCFRCDASEWDTIIDRIRREFVDRSTGEGTFHLRGFTPQIDPNTGERSKRVRCFMNRFIRVKASKTWLAEQDRIREKELAGRLQQDSNQDLILQGLKDISVSFTQALQALAPKPGSMMERLQEMKLMTEMFRPQREERDPLEVVEKMLTIKNKLEMATGSGETSYMPMMMELAKPMIEGLKQQNAAKAESIQPTQPVTQQPEEPEMNMLNIMMGRVLNAAKNDADPYVYASLILEHAPEPVIESLINASDWFQQLCTIAPQAAQYKPWFEQVREEIINLTTDPEPVNANQQINPNVINAGNAKT